AIVDLERRARRLDAEAARTATLGVLFLFLDRTATRDAARYGRPRNGTGRLSGRLLAAETGSGSITCIATGLTRRGAGWRAVRRRRGGVRRRLGSRRSRRTFCRNVPGFLTRFFFLPTSFGLRLKTGGLGFLGL